MGDLKNEAEFVGANYSTGCTALGNVCLQSHMEFHLLRPFLKIHLKGFEQVRGYTKMSLMYGPVIYCSWKPMFPYDLYTANACLDRILHFSCVVISLKHVGHLLFCHLTCTENTFMAIFKGRKFKMETAHPFCPIAVGRTQ